MDDGDGILVSKSEEIKKIEVIFSSKFNKENFTSNNIAQNFKW